MKKIFTLLTTGLLTISASAQIYFEDDFEGGTLTANNAWTSQTVANPDAINGSWVLGTISGNYAKQGNFVSGANHILDSWFISPVINLSTATVPTMKFRNTKRYDGDDINIMISTDYDGTSLPATATWTDISSLFTLDNVVGSFIFINSGDGDITSYISGSPSTVYIAFQYIGTATDGSTWEIDDVVIQEGPSTTNITPIYDIQYSLIGDSPELGNIVTTPGIVTGVVLFGSNVDRFFIQDGDGARNGIYVYENGYTVAIGDSVLVTGEVLEFNSLTELGFVSDVTVVSSGNALPNPATVTNATIADEEWEGVLVRLDDAIAMTATDGFGVWTANDGTGTTVKVDDDLLSTAFAATLGNGYDVIGIRHYAFGENLLLPKSLSDIVTVGYAGIEEDENVFTIYPNPATDFITISATVGSIVNVYASTGALVATGLANNKLDVSELGAGMYQVVVTNELVQTTQKLVIR